MEVIAVVGLGYVGLPLAVAFGKLMPTLGYDLSSQKIDHYRRHVDPSSTVASDDMRQAAHLSFTDDAAPLAGADFFIIAVPTPIDSARKPDFQPLIRASEDVGAHLKRGATVIYESTVYPGATEEVCIPVLERVSGLKWQRDFVDQCDVEIALRVLDHLRHLRHADAGCAMRARAHHAPVQRID